MTSRRKLGMAFSLFSYKKAGTLVPANQSSRKPPSPRKGCSPADAVWLGSTRAESVESQHVRGDLRHPLRNLHILCTSPRLTLNGTHYAHITYTFYISHHKRFEKYRWGERGDPAGSRGQRTGGHLWANKASPRPSTWP